MNTLPFAGRIFEIYEGGEGLSGMLERLLAGQKNDWKELRNNYSLIGERQKRTLSAPGAGRIVLQCNPGRIGSTLAKVDRRSVEERKCFLCEGNLPSGQKGILYRGDYLALCNPYPIFKMHFTIACIDHRPQGIMEHLDRFLMLAEDVGPGFSIFYNGPQCGASAPDHLHFQACPCGELPIESEHFECYPPLFKSKSAEIRVAGTAGRGVVVVTAPTLNQAKNATAKVIAALHHDGASGETGIPEPLLNIIARKEQGGLKIMIFPRRKFRPDCFYLEGEKRIAVSPAAVELGGLIITPLQKDFDRLDFAGAVSILKEVSLDAESIAGILGQAGVD